MMKFARPPQPTFLQKQYKQWGREHKAKREADPAAMFRWKTYEHQPVNQHLLEALNVSAKKHCAFCDGFPLGPFARETLEHFRPVSRYPRLAYVWWNLFICCDQCQATKRDQFDRKLLKPDAEEYTFSRYFISNYSTGEIEVNPAASTADQKRAEITIQFYGLNAHGRPQSRLREYRQYNTLAATKEYELDDFPYRFFLE